jgi:hypothetical protein
VSQIAATVRLPAVSSGAAARALADLLETLSTANAEWFRDHPDAPRCAACAGASYRLPSMQRRPTYYSALDILGSPQHGWQCADLVAYDVGRLRSRGKSAGVVMIERAPYDFHVVLESPKGSNELYDISQQISQGEGCPCLL